MNGGQLVERSPAVAPAGAGVVVGASHPHRAAPSGGASASPGRCVLSVRVPYPPAGLSPNRRLHRLERAKIVADYRRLVAVLAREAVISTGRRMRPHPRVVLVVVVHPPDRRPRDLDNIVAALKPAIDGLQDAGVIVGDSMHAVPAVVVRAAEPVPGGAVELRIVGRVLGDRESQG